MTQAPSQRTIGKVQFSLRPIGINNNQMKNLNNNKLLQSNFLTVLFYKPYIQSPEKELMLVK